MVSEREVSVDERTRVAFAARARVLKAMAHESRLYVLSVLAGGERTVGELTDLVGVDVSTVSRHLGVLRSAGLVESEKRGAQVFYRLVCTCIEPFFGCVESVIQGNARRSRDVAGSCRRSACVGQVQGSEV